MKIYTKSGDKGETGLIGGKRVLKSNQRIIAYGCIDELNSGLGLTISLLRQNSKNIFADIIDILTKIQNDLFIVGADLADPSYDIQKTFTGIRNKTPPYRNDYDRFLRIYYRSVRSRFTSNHFLFAAWGKFSKLLTSFEQDSCT